MGFRKLVKKVAGPIPVITVCAALLFALCTLIVQLLNDEASGQLQLWITLLGGFGIGVLVFFLVINCYSLYRQYSRNEIGSKLTSKIVLIFLFLTLIPFALVYFFSIQFLNKGIDSWFDVRVEQAVQDALLLGQTSLDGIKEEISNDVENYANNLPKNMDPGQLLKTLDEIREAEDYVELTLYTDDGRILAFSSEDGTRMLPDTPGDEVFAELRLNQSYTSLEPISDNTQQFRVVAPIAAQEYGREFYGLQAIKLLPLRYATLASSVETALNQYDQMLFARGPLKFSLFVTLSLISLSSFLFSILTAVFLSKRMVAPISNLAAGTKKIAEGDYGSKLPVTSSDELGILTESFNNMSLKINDAQKIAKASQQETEEQRGFLEAVLTNLSSGVFVFDEEKKLEICNSAAADILGANLDDKIGFEIGEISAGFDQLKKFFDQIETGLDSGLTDWQDETTLLGLHGRQILIVRGTLLSNLTSFSAAHSQANDDYLRSPTNHDYVVVFDDVTNLIQAQRDAAWGEVARRLAHEIKNPLTPIQLSAERIRNKFADNFEGEQKNMLERSTRTIVQQVESMKEMVNAFSSYAQPVRATLLSLDLNQLIKDVIELHTSEKNKILIEQSLAQDLPMIKANASALRQVLNNLIINAFQALEDRSDGKISIITDKAVVMSGNYVDLVIADNGSGIPEDIRDSLFDPYVSSKAKGSGLGLAIVKRIIEEHSGSVWVEDNSGKGTAMHVRLPINAMQTYRGNRSQNTLHSDTSENIIGP
ncbi:MAG: HAMP domain-containing protein [Acidiferrobacterales bacterium]|nr:HAMP domain-containing protein [Acidiferrobacterales bacterium]